MYHILFTNIAATAILFCAFIIFAFVFYPRHMLGTQLNTLAMLTNIKCNYTEYHSKHVGILCGLLYKELSHNLKRRISRKNLITAGNLHDIGKLYVSDLILCKNCELTADEYENIKLHASTGALVLHKTGHRKIAHIVALHHERIDGAGYYGISGCKIPLESKIIAIADTFSSLVTDRPYRKAVPINTALRIIKECAGTQLDEQLVEYFLRVNINDLIAADVKAKIKASAIQGREVKQ